MPNVVTVQINSYRDFLNSLLPFSDCKYGEIGQKFIFRGESTNKYSLLPRSLRKNEIDKWCGPLSPLKPQNGYESLETSQICFEFSLLRMFYERSNHQGLHIPHPDILKRDKNAILFHPARPWLFPELVDIAALAQHYGTPTRLLDWSFDYRIALYFAASSACKKYENNEPDASDKMVVWALNKSRFDFINTTVEHTPLRFVVPAYAENPNVCAQKGILSYWEVEYCSKIEAIKNKTSHSPTQLKPLDELIFQLPQNNDTLLYKFEIPINQRKDILAFLSIQGIDASFIYPGYQGVSKAIYERVFLYSHDVKK